MFIDDVTGEIVPTFFRTGYNYDRDSASRESGLECLDESLAVQASRDEADINTIVRRFGLTGELPSDVKMPLAGDYEGITDYHTAMNAVIAADAAFMEFPASVRSRFDNNPQKLLEFVADPANLDEARRLGLAIPAPTAVEPMAVRVVAEPPGTVST